MPPELHDSLVFAAHAVEAAKCLQAGRLMYLVCAHAPEPEIRAYGLLFLTKAWTHTNTYTDWEIFGYIECFTDALKRPGAWGRHVDWDWSHVAAVLRTLLLRMQRDKNCTTVTDILRCMCVMLDSVHAQGLCACLCAADVVPGGGSHCKCSTVALEWAHVPGPLLGSCCFLTSSNSYSDNSVLRTKLVVSFLRLPGVDARAFLEAALMNPLEEDVEPCPGKVQAMFQDIFKSFCFRLLRALPMELSELATPWTQTTVQSTELGLCSTLLGVAHTRLSVADHDLMEALREQFARCMHACV